MATGLDGVVVASTVLSEVDGEQGRLVMRGLPVEAIAGTFTFEAAAARLWDGLSGVTETEETVRRSLGTASPRWRPTRRSGTSRTFCGCSAERRRRTSR